MNLERLFELVLSNPENISIRYSNINGVEKLIVNDEDLTIDLEESFDDTSIKELIAKYKNTIERLDDCDFLQIVEQVTAHLDVKTFDELINQTSFSREDAAIIESMIGFMNLVIHEHLTNKIADLQDILENL